jgi:hypothetical protein
MALRQILAALALVGAVALVVSPVRHPVDTGAFSLLGHALGTAERDVRVLNTFVDAAANDNANEHPAFPGSTGAVLAIRKAHAEWGSGPWMGHGLGDGMASNPNLGDGGANLDQHFQGEAVGPLPLGSNVHQAMTGGPCAGAVIAFTQFSPGGGSGGWTITYCDGTFVWSDGPGEPGLGQIDLQAIATREIGFTLGLGHSSVSGSTMFPSVVGSVTNARSIEADDIAGLQAIYGKVASGKPRITDVSGSDAPGGALVIDGEDFDPFSNEIWLPSPGGSGAPVVLGGVPSTTGGTRITVTLPTGIDVGDLMVKVPGVGGARLSNAWPLEPSSPPGSFGLTGPGLGGASGEVPQLTGSGDLSPGSGSGFALELDLAAPGVFGVLFVGAGEGDIPFKGGVFDPVPILLELPFTTSAGGTLSLASAFPASTPGGLELVTQIWLADPTGPKGATASNGLSLRLP